MKIKRLHEKALLPRYSTEGASAFDLFCYEDVQWKESTTQVRKFTDTPDEYEVVKCHTALVHTGWSMEIPHECGLFILSRSGHGFNHTTTLVNSVGLLDYDYRGEAMVKLVCFDNTPPVIEAGKAVAQCVLMSTPKCYFMVSDELSETQRNENGFGSTDKNSN